MNRFIFESFADVVEVLHRLTNKNESFNSSNIKWLTLLRLWTLVCLLCISFFLLDILGYSRTDCALFQLKINSFIKWVKIEFKQVFVSSNICWWLLQMKRVIHCLVFWKVSRWKAMQTTGQVDSALCVVHLQMQHNLNFIRFVLSTTSASQNMNQFFESSPNIIRIDSRFRVYSIQKAFN